MTASCRDPRPRRRPTPPAALSAALVLLAGPPAAAQTAPGGSAADAGAPRAVEARLLEGSLRIDGRIDEDAWARADVASGFVQSEPEPGAPASERTEARVLFDADALYVGVRLHDRAPDSIVARLARRDEAVYSDWVIVGVDSYFDRRTAFAFGLNAAGVKLDMRISDDTDTDDTWDAVWDGAAAVDEGGWSAEFRIPLSQLRFSRGGEGGDESRTWGLNLERRIARKEETAYWSPVPNDAGVFVSRFGELRGIGRLEAPRRVELMPYTMGRLTREPGNGENPFYEENAFAGKVGGDVRVGLGSGLTLSATLNPDFGQVEADPSVVNLSAFETFYPEKRPFFVEGADLFGISGPSVFYSRRIGRRPQASAPSGAAFSDVPEAATILGAAKVSGKTADGWSVGVLGAVTAEEEAPYVNPDGAEGTAAVEPRTGYAVARVARDLNEGRTTLGGIVTATRRSLDAERLSFLRSGAYVAGLEGRHRFRDDRYELSGSVVGSRVTGDSLAIDLTQRAPGHYFQRPDADHLDYEPGRGDLGGLAGRLRVARVGGGSWRWGVVGSLRTPGLELNDLGFNFSNDRASVDTYLRYVEFSPGGSLRSWSAGISQFNEYTLGGERLELNGTAELSVEWLNGWGGRVWAMRHQPGVDPDALRGGPALRQPGRWMGSFSVHSDRRQSVGAESFLYWETQDENDAYRLHGMLGLTLRPSPRIEVGLTPFFTVGRDDWQWVGRRTVEGTDHYVLARIEQKEFAMTVRADYTFSPELSLQVYAQPFVGSGRYGRFMTVERPNAERWADQFRRYGPGEISARTEGGVRLYDVDADADGSAEFTLTDPDFSFRQLRSNVVLRWEYRPGSTLFLVWSQDRTAFLQDAAFRPFADVADLLDSDGSDVFLVKLSYWIGR